MKIKSEEKGKVSHKRNSSLGIVIVSITLKCMQKFEGNIKLLWLNS